MAAAASLLLPASAAGAVPRTPAPSFQRRLLLSVPASPARGDSSRGCALVGTGNRRAPTVRRNAAETVTPYVPGSGKYIAPDYLVKKVSAKEVEELVRGERKVPLIVDFYATWCGPCVQMAQDIEMVWDIMEDILLQPDMEDTHTWKLSPSGKYSAKSAYESLFRGATTFQPWERIWKTWAPPKCRFFMWIVAHKRCWTADRLAHHGLPHQERCPLCEQEEESVDHLLVGCVFARQFWYYMLRQVGLHSLAPQPDEQAFDSWWKRAAEVTRGLHQQGLNSLVVLGAWMLWNHRNRCV